MMVRGRDWSGRRLACTVRGTRGGRVVGTGVSSKPQNHECGRHSSERQPVDDAETAVVISRRRGRWHSLAVRVDCGWGDKSRASGWAQPPEDGKSWARCPPPPPERCTQPPELVHTDNAMFYIVAETTRTVVSLSTRQTRKRSLRHRPQPIPGGGTYRYKLQSCGGHPVAPLEAWPLRRRRSLLHTLTVT